VMRAMVSTRDSFKHHKQAKKPQAIESGLGIEIHQPTCIESAQHHAVEGLCNSLDSVDQFVNAKPCQIYPKGIRPTRPLGVSESRFLFPTARYDSPGRDSVDDTFTSSLVGRAASD